MSLLTKQIKTMSSREIAELTNKRHPDVTRDIEKMLKELEEDVSKFAHIYLDSMNRQQTEYLLDRELTDTLLTGYSAVLRRRVVARWHELEQEVSKPAIPDFEDPIAAGEAWIAAKKEARAEAARADLEATKAEKLEHQVAELAPAAAGLERIANADGAMCVTDAAKTLQMQPHKLRDALLEMAWMYRRQGKGGYVAYQDKIHSGYLKHKVGNYRDPETGENKTNPQVLVTSKGLAQLSKLLGASTPKPPAGRSPSRLN